jgi:multicomponent K+:H+ antiporter subunit A
MILPVAVLVGQCLLVGLFPNYTVAPLLALASADMLGGPLPEYDLAIWHGFNAPFIMSLIALIGGIALYSLRRRLFDFHERLNPGIDYDLIFQKCVDRIVGAARAITMTMENGSLQRYATLLLLAASAAFALPIVTGKTALLGEVPLTGIDPVSLTGAVLIMAAALATVLWRRQRLTALIALSVVGLVAVLTFARFSAPDLALTQLAVEIATIILLLLALHFLPQQDRVESPPLRSGRDLLPALTIGGGMGLLTWAMLTRPFASISGYFMENSLPRGGGANVVNVILVDFRGFDTMGEITVLAIAAVGIYAMLDHLCLEPGTLHGIRRRWAPERQSPILTQITRFLLPMALIVSIYLFLRGHNAPGGGFIAGLTTAIALILQYMASGIAWTQQQWRQKYHKAIAWGLLIATFTGIGSRLFDHPFLTSSFGHFHLPLIGEFELATALLFDLGVYFTVVGVVMLILATLGKLSERCLEFRRVD